MHTTNDLAWNEVPTTRSRRGGAGKSGLLLGLRGKVTELGLLRLLLPGLAGRHSKGLGASKGWPGPAVSHHAGEGVDGRLTCRGADQTLPLSVPELTPGPRAGVAPVMGVPDVSGAGRVREPGAVGGAGGVDVLAGGAVEGALLVEVARGAVAGDAGAEAGDLAVVAGLVLDATRDVRPCEVVLE